MSNIYNVPAGCSLTDVLAEYLLNKYRDNPLKLTDVTVFLPNRRAVRELRNAFVRADGTTATLLPHILPLGGLDEDGYFFSGENPALPETVSPEERLMIFIRLITARPDNFKIGHISFAQACFLAGELASLMDMVKNEGLDFSRLQNLVPEEYAAHWQDTLDFLKIITEFYPQILQERGLVDVAEHNNALLNGQNDIWLKNPPQDEVIVAGTTATFPVMKKLVKTVLMLPHGALWLSGVDKHLDDDSWNMIDETHPQFELKQLLDFLQISRFEVKDVVETAYSEREKLLSEVMRPAPSTDKWRQVEINKEALDGLKIITCRDSREEALSIAAIMRHNLETPEKTTALITADRNLARRVSNELLRWGVEADDSAGIPLAQTPQGIFLRLVAAVCDEDFAPLSFLSLYKHPLTLAGKSSGKIRAEVRNYEKRILRNRNACKLQDNDFIDLQKPFFAELYELMQQPQAEFKDLLTAHIRVAERLASSDGKKGADILWAGEEGETAAAHLSSLLAAAETLGKIPQGQYTELFEALLSGVTVRSKYGSHPRLRILGPIEARLCNFDCTIISGMNEGSMPTTVSCGAWMSRPMKKDFGFPLPEKAIGVLAHDFCEAACGKEVFLTRAERVDGAPTVKSRWLLRMETVINASGLKAETLYHTPYLQWIRQLDITDEVKPANPPCPHPPVESRPRELWASDMERLIRDPYMIFASKILKLKKMEDISDEPDAMDIGTIIHEVLERFYKAYPEQIPENAAEIMSELGDTVFEEYDLECESKAFLRPRLQRIIKWVLNEDKKIRPDIKHTYCEAKGKISFESKGGTFTVGAKADRIDKNKDGTVSILDYKTGSARSEKEVKLGYAPQLPIEGIIAMQGGFENIDAAPVKNICYWQLDNKATAIEKDIEDILQDNFEKIKSVIEAFDDEKTGYVTKPNLKHVETYSDYVHLSRIDEWEVNENEN